MLYSASIYMTVGERFQGDWYYHSMGLDWHDAVESLNEYRCNSFDLPSDHSLISPVARVILQKRRLLKIQEIHNIILQISSEPSQSITQVRQCIVR